VDVASIIPAGPFVAEEKRVALREVYAWLEGRGRSNHAGEWRLGGYAGTGKTRMISYIVELCNAMGLRVAVCAFTGKAVSVLREKGMWQATTLHKLLYKPYTDAEGRICFKRVPRLEYDVVIVDEGSMLSTPLYMDLRAHFGVRRIIVGDPAQLAPVGADPRLMHDCDMILNDIHRQGALSPILALAQSVRLGNIDLEVGTWGDARTGRVTITRDAVADLMPYDVAICGYNSTRHKINRMKRRALGYTQIVEEGEMLMCLKNDDQDGGSGLHNGVMGRATNVRDDGDNLVADITDQAGNLYPEISLRREIFGRDYVRDVEDPEDTRLPFAYGHGITGHKSQASQWSSVFVKNEMLPNSDHERWLYTVITRAERDLTIKI